MLHPGPTTPLFLVRLPLVREAARFAAERHAGQRRDSDQAPFVLHPLEVAALLQGRGFDEEVVAAGILHDLVEETATTVDELRGRFGDRVADIVAALTDDPSIDDEVQRKAALRRQVRAAAPEAQAVYAADKVAKARELRARITRTGRLDDAARRKLHHFESSLQMLEDVAPDLPLTAQLHFEVWALRHLPPRSAGDHDDR